MDVRDIHWSNCEKGSGVRSSLAYPSITWTSGVRRPPLKKRADIIPPCSPQCNHWEQWLATCVRRDRYCNYVIYWSRQRYANFADQPAKIKRHPLVECSDLLQTLSHHINKNSCSSRSKFTPWCSADRMFHKQNSRQHTLIQHSRRNGGSSAWHFLSKILPDRLF
jgi:hypothetical protein